MQSCAIPGCTATDPLDDKYCDTCTGTFNKHIVFDGRCTDECSRFGYGGTATCTCPSFGTFEQTPGMCSSCKTFG